MDVIKKAARAAGKDWVLHKLGRRSLINRKELESWVNHNMPPRIQGKNLGNT